MNRWPDWWEQSSRDIRHAQNALDDADYEWAAFAAQQAAEKALKAVILAHGGQPWGHSLLNLIESLPEAVAKTDKEIEAASRLDKHYIPARYPNGLAAGFPGKLYTKGEAQAAISDAALLIDFSRRHLPRP